MKYAVVYNGGNNESKYVGSLSDYKSGEFSANPILMSEDEANELLKELDNYVRNVEFIGDTNEDNEQVHWAYEKHEWGFQIEELEINDYMGALVATNGDPMLIEDEEEAAGVAHAVDEYGIEEIERGSEEFEDAMAKLNLSYANTPMHIYRAGEYIICKDGDWDFAIGSLQELADYINGDDYNQLEVDRIVEANGWEDLSGENDYDVCSYMGEKVTLDENTGEAKVVDDNRERIRIGQRIADIRKQQGMTQAQLAEATGLLQPNIARIENGRYGITLDVLARIAQALGKRIDLV